MVDTLYIPSPLNSYFLEKLKKLPAVGTFTCYGERPEIAAWKIWGDTGLGWLLMYYNNCQHPFDGTFSNGKVLLFPSLNSIEKLYATLNTKQRAAEKEGS